MLHRHWHPDCLLWILVITGLPWVKVTFILSFWKVSKTQKQISRPQISLTSRTVGRQSRCYRRQRHRPWWSQRRSSADPPGWQPTPTSGRKIFWENIKIIWWRIKDPCEVFEIILTLILVVLNYLWPVMGFNTSWWVQNKYQIHIGRTTSVAWRSHWIAVQVRALWNKVKIKWNKILCSGIFLSHILRQQGKY